MTKGRTLTYPLRPEQSALFFASLAYEGRRSGVGQVIAPLASEPTEDHLAAAWRAAVRKYDALRAVPFWDGANVPVLTVLPSNDVPPVAAPRIYDSDSRLLELDHPLAANRPPLARLAMFRSATPGENAKLLLTYDHLVLDQAGARAVLASLLRLAGDQHDPEMSKPIVVPCWTPDKNPCLETSPRSPGPSPAGTAEQPAWMVEPVAPTDLGAATHTFDAALTQQLTAFATSRGIAVRSVLVAAFGLLRGLQTLSSQASFSLASSNCQAELVASTSIHGWRVYTAEPVPVGAWVADLDARLAAGCHIAATRAERDCVLEIRCADNRNPLMAGWDYWNATFACSVTIGEPTTVRMSFDPRFLTSEVVDGLPAIFASIVRTIVGSPGRRLPDLVFSDLPAARPALPPDGPAEVESLTRRFERFAASRPNAPAIDSGARTTSYDELNRRANRIAHRLRQLGVGPETMVALCPERSIDLVVGMLAIVKAGGVYVPLDPADPPRRIRELLADIGPQVLLAHRRLLADLPHPRPCPVLHPEDPDDFAALPATNLEHRGLPANLAYVIYTSGSTGRPKGVMVHHEALLNLLDWMRRQLSVAETDRILHKTAPTFDVSVWELLLPLTSGATIVLADREARRDPYVLHQLLVEQGVTIAHVVPPMLRALLSALSPTDRLPVRSLLCGGQSLPDVDRERCLAWTTGQVLHLYGPTETTIDVTASVCRPGIRTSIGQAISNVRLHVLDEQLRAVPAGLTGELCVAGTAVARGYLNRPDLTAERFVPDPFGPPGGRLYRTGDLVRRRSDGDLVFLGRRDNQVKVRGHRVEPGEVEAALRTHPSVEDAIVTAHVDTSGTSRLVAYVRTALPRPAGHLRTYLRDLVPEFMVPSVFVPVEEFPMTSSGKVNRQALPRPGRNNRVRAAATRHRSPTETALAHIWRSTVGGPDPGSETNLLDGGVDEPAAIRMLCAARKAGFDLTPADLVRNPTISGLADAARQVEASG